MKLKKFLSVAFFFILGIVATHYLKPAAPELGKHNVVVTFTILEDFAKQLLQDIPEVRIHTLINRGQDPHSFCPHPKICILLRQADITIINGLNFEPWFTVCQKEVLGQLVVASNGVVPLRQIHEPSSFDPHAWLDVGNAMIYVHNMRDVFKKAYPQFSEIIEHNYQSFMKKLKQLHNWIPRQFILLKDRTIITTHDAFWYYGKAYRIPFVSPQGISSEEEISATKMAQLIRIIKQRNVKALFLENLSNSAIIKQLSEETNTRIGGILFADSLSDTKGPCSTYIEMMQHNTKSIQKALSS